MRLQLARSGRFFPLARSGPHSDQPQTSTGISRLFVSKILNHAEPGATAVYDRHSYDAEKRAALASWSARIEEIIGARRPPENVVALRSTG